MNRRNNELMNDVNDPFFDNLARRFFGPVSDWMDWATPSIASTAVNGLLTDVKETKALTKFMLMYLGSIRTTSS